MCGSKRPQSNPSLNPKEPPISTILFALLALSNAHAGVVGTPITTSAPEFTGRDKSTITKAELSDVAMAHIDDQREAARAQVEGYKSRYGDGISVLVSVYNASGEPLVLHGMKLWYGHTDQYTPPSRIENGQWGTVLYVHPAGEMLGTNGALVYNIGGRSSRIDYLVAGWEVPYTNLFGNSNRTWCRVEDNDTEYSVTGWDTHQSRIHDDGLLKKTRESNACNTTCSIGSGSSPALEVIVERTR